MRTLVFGGAGFVGLNIAERLLAQGDEVVLFDRIAIPDAARSAFAALPGRLETVSGDVTDPAAIAAVLRPDVDGVVLGAVITADAAREAREPETILQVNLMALPAILRAARDAGVRRVVNLSSAAAYGSAAFGVERVDEETPLQPSGLYGITKQGSELIGQRLAQLWSLDFVSLRLSAVFGPWERATGVRDTTSAPFQITEAARLGTPALLGRPGVRDWVYAPDVAHAVSAVMQAPLLRHAVYNVSSPACWSALAWGQALAALRPGFECRLAGPQESPTIALHSEADRAPLSTHRLQQELGWSAAFGLADSAAHLEAWCRTPTPQKESS
ncbi:NAD-dependent epimerase/dehydratase family protein [Xylophilus rhododendri]|uniref:NAD-dependent epimerase/dehydratase family protein n=1 Tax=Xylophilus rhododendri TaxID=2697032 RepID=A0A857JAN4_9BURK|nr:NAD(P)-dependent oxidoreductase [Xylophilus rhododendri]QHJ00043.1 NAD-dependent epimerase/dehydratase family protein [Xylophilus rhododendri]